MRLRSFLGSVLGVVLCLVVANHAFDPTFEWVRQGGGPPVVAQSVDESQGIDVDAAGNVYIAGMFRWTATFGLGEPNQTNLTGGKQDFFVAKYDANGRLIWARRAGGNGLHQDWLFGIAVDPAGNSYITGFLTDMTSLFEFGNGVELHSQGAFVAKYDTEGNAVWATTLDPNAVAWGLDVDANGNTYIAGATADPANGNPLITVWKVGASGTPQWARTAAGAHSGNAIGVSVDASGNVSVTGELFGTATFGQGEQQQTILTNVASFRVLFVARYAPSGNLLWARQSVDDAAFSGRGNAISTDAGGNSYVLGVGYTAFEPGGEPVDTFFVKYDAAGGFAWAKTVTSPYGSVSGVFDVDSTPAGDTYLTGTSVQGNIFIQRYNSGGDLLWSRVFAAIAAIDVLALQGNGIAADGGDNVYVTGNFSSSVRFGVGEPNETILSTTSGNQDFDIFVAKYRGDTPVQNTPPVATGQEVTTPEDTPLTVTLTATDADNDPLTCSTVTAPAHGTVTISGCDAIYTPALNYFGPDQFTFLARDGHADSNTATVTITVTPVNDAPVAHDQAVATPEDTPVVITLTGHDVEGSQLGFGIATLPSHGTVSLNGAAATYTPALDYVGPDSFTFTASDGLLPSVPATVTITVGLTNIGCGTLTSGAIGAAGETDRYAFAGQAGQIISLAIASTGGFGTSPGSTSAAELALFAPSGAGINVIRSNSQGQFTLTETGTYVLRVGARNRTTTGSYNLNLECLVPPSPDAIALPCGTLASGQIDAPAEVDLFTVSGQTGQVISLALASTGGFATSPGSTSAVELALFAPSGTGINVLRSNGHWTLTLPQTGTYVVRVNARNLSTTGSYNLNFECLSPPSPDAIALPCGTLASGQIDAPGEVDLFTLSGQTGQVISLALASTGGFATSPGSTSAVELALFAPSGTGINVLRSNGHWSLTLPETGTYVVRVSARNLSTTGSYNLNLECLSPPSMALPLQCGTLVSGQISAVGQVDLFTLSGQAGQVISLALASTGGFATSPGSTSAVELALFAPSGTGINVLRSNGHWSLTLPETGTYAVRVSARNLSTTGSYNLNLECLVPPSPDAVPLTCGAPAFGQIDAPGDVDLFTLQGQAGQVISLALASTGGFATSPGSTSAAELALFAPSGAGINVLRSNSQRTFTLQETGTYVVRVSARNLSTTGSYRVTVGCTVPPPSPVLRP